MSDLVRNPVVGFLLTVNANFFFRYIFHEHAILIFAPDYYTHFIIGESMLEVYGRETTGIEQNMATAKTKLSEAERHLKLVLKENGKVGKLSCL